MQKLKSVFNNFTITMDLFALAILMVFFMMVKPVEEVQDLLHHNGYLYVAVGKQGIQVLDIESDPENPVEIGVYNTSGVARDLAIRNGGDAYYLYVAVERKGIEAYKILEEGRLQFQWHDGSINSSQAIAVYDEYGFIARGKRGLMVMNIGKQPPDDPNQQTYKWDITQIQGNQEEMINLDGANLISIQGKRAYVVDRSWNLHILNIGTPREPRQLGMIPIGRPVNDLFIYHGIGYVATEGGGLILVDLFTPEGGAIINQYEGMKDVRSVTLYGPFAYITGGESGIHVINVANPTQEIIKIGQIEDFVTGMIAPYRVTEEDQPLGGGEIREKIDAQRLIQVGDYLYCADGLKGLRVIHHDPAFTVTGAERLGGSGEEQGWSEDLVVIERDIEGNNRRIAYIVGKRRGLWMLDVTDPQSVQDITEGVDQRGRATAIAVRGENLYVGYENKGIIVDPISNPNIGSSNMALALEQEFLDIKVIDDRYISFVSGSNGFSIVDVSNPDSLQLVGHTDTGGNALGIAIQDDHAFVADGVEGLQIINILDRQKPAIVSQVVSGFDAQAVATLKVQENENSPVKIYAYVANGSGGVAIIDASDPRNPKQLGSLPTAEFAQDVYLRDNVLFVTDRREGLTVFSLENPESPIAHGRIDTPGQAHNIYILGTFAYIADYDRGLRIITIANIDDLRESGSFDLPSEVVDLVVADNQIAYLADIAGLWTVNVENHSSPVPIDLLKSPYGVDSISLGPYKTIEITPSESTESQAEDSEESQTEIEMKTIRYAYTVETNIYPDPSLDVNQISVVDLLTNVHSPSFVASYPGLDDTRSIEVRDNFAYVADGKNGVRILDVSDITAIQQVGSLGVRGDAKALDIAGNYLYAVTGIGQFEIANIQNPIAPTPIQPEPSMDSILADTRNVFLVSDRSHAYISAGVNGLYVYDVNQPFTPKQLIHFDTPGDLQNVVVNGYYTFLADGVGGVTFIFSPEPSTFITNPDWYFAFSEDTTESESVGLANCRAVAVDVLPNIIKDKDNERNLYHYVYVAAKNCGLLTLEYKISVALTGKGFVITPGEARFFSVVGSYLDLVIDSIRLIWIKSSETDIGFDYILRLVYQVFKGKVNALNPRIQNATILYLFGVFLFSTNIIFWLGLIAHFVLPVRRPNEAWRSFTRLFRFYRNMHGPIVNATEGKMEITELKPESPGVALVDMNSAVVIEEFPARKPRPRSQQRKIQEKRRDAGQSLFQARAEGPGVVFLEPYERVREAADLRRQIRSRLQVKGLTQDGIEVSTLVYVIFTLGEAPDVKYVTYDGEKIAENIRVIELKDEKVPIQGKMGVFHTMRIVDALHDEDLDDEEKLEIHQFVQRYRVGQVNEEMTDEEITGVQKGPYLFNEKKVFRAILSEPYDVEDKEYKTWTELPAHVAAAEFRNLLSKELYDNLFQPDDPQKYEIQRMKRALANRIQHFGTVAYQYVERLDGKPIVIHTPWVEKKLVFAPKRELRTPKPLRSRGIKVITANFTVLTPMHDDVTSHLTNYWRSEWEKESAIIDADLKRQAMGFITTARSEAQNDLINSLMMILEDTRLSREALALRIFQTLEDAAYKSETRRLLPGDAIQILKEIHALLLPGDAMPMFGGMAGRMVSQVDHFEAEDNVIEPDQPVDGNNLSQPESSEIGADGVEAESSPDLEDDSDANQIEDQGEDKEQDSSEPKNDNLTSDQV